MSELTFGGHSQSVFSVSGCPTSQPEDRILNNIFDLNQSKHEPIQARWTWYMRAPPSCFFTACVQCGLYRAYGGVQIKIWEVTKRKENAWWRGKYKCYESSRLSWYMRGAEDHKVGNDGLFLVKSWKNL